MVEKIQGPEEEYEIHREDNVLEADFFELFLGQEIKGKEGGCQGRRESQGKGLLIRVGQEEKISETQEDQPQ